MGTIYFIAGLILGWLLATFNRGFCVEFNYNVNGKEQKRSLNDHIKDFAGSVISQSDIDRVLE